MSTLPEQVLCFFDCVLCDNKKDSTKVTGDLISHFSVCKSNLDGKIRKRNKKKNTLHRNKAQRN